jgi:hypothetical protein
MQFYHLDRNARSLKPGFVLPLYRASFVDTWTPEEAAYFHELYPDGLSNFGLHYYGLDPAIPGPVRLREKVLEQIRCNDFPHLPSRFTAYFACESVEDALRLRDQGLLYDGRLNADALIWKVEAAEWFRADMDLFRAVSLNRSLPVIYDYWRQVRGQSPFWECLLNPPVTVIESMT